MNNLWTESKQLHRSNVLKIKQILSNGSNCFDYFSITEAIKSDPGAPSPVATTSTSDTADKSAKSGRGKSKAGSKVKVEAEEDEEEVDSKAAKSGAKAAKSGAKIRPAGKICIR